MEQEAQNISVFYLHYCWCCCLTESNVPLLHSLIQNYISI